MEFYKIGPCWPAGQSLLRLEPRHDGRVLDGPDAALAPDRRNVETPEEWVFWMTTLWRYSETQSPRLLAQNSVPELAKPDLR
jgi:hypothetical protein